MTDLRKIDINLIVVAQAILLERNLTKAGARLGMSQPAVSGALARLRQQYGDPLLTRQGRTFELTEKAESILPLINEAVHALNQTVQLLPTFDPATSQRTFYISASDYALAQLTSPLTNLLKEHAPGVRVVCDSLPAGSGVTPEDLLKRDVIIAGTGRGLPGKKRALFSDRFVCVADATNPRIRNGAFTLEDLAALRHVKASFGEGNKTHIDDMLAEAGLVPDIAWVVQGFLPVPLAVAGTALIGHVPQILAERYAASLNLAIVNTPLQAFLVEAAHWHPSKNSDPAVTWLVEMLYLTAEKVEFDTE
ncbi:LysR family transcriptional regulator [Glutamicibacter uratoxydans]|uniref:LysR family transcriptional regulator n=1 Tax=Glutamicibacter uratoxydans TaxID=43667 RepID=UPI003D6EC09F